MTTPATRYKFKPVFNKKKETKDVNENENNDKNIQEIQEYIQLTDIKDKKDRCEAIDAYLTFSNSGSNKQSNSRKVRRRL